MTVLSKQQVIEMMGAGEIQIDPFSEGHLAENGLYTFTLGSTFKIPVNKRDGKSALRMDQADRVKYRTIKMADREDISLQGSMEKSIITVDTSNSPDILPNGFALLETAERIKLGHKVYCLLSTHPSLAKVGLDLVQSSIMVTPMSNCHLTLETTSSGIHAIKFVPGVKAVKAMFLM